MKIVKTSTPRDVRLFEGEDYPANLDPTDVVEIFETPLTGSYNWDYTVQDNRIKKLYELGKQLNWNVEVDVDWTPEFKGVRSEEFDFEDNQWSKHPEYAKLASRICISNHHKHTHGSFKETIQELYDSNIIQKYLYDLVQDNLETIKLAIDYQRDYDIDFFGFKTLERSYLLKVNGNIIERPQDLFMRVAICIQRDNILEAINVYQSLSKKLFKL